MSDSRALSSNTEKLPELLRTLEHFAACDRLQQARTEVRKGRVWLLPKIELPELTEARSAVEAFIARLQETVLTPEDAELALNFMGRWTDLDNRYPAEKILREKLRRISEGAR